MKAPVFRSNPEKRTQKRIVTALSLRRWFVRETHGNAFQKGFPDLFCWHEQYGLRWVDVKYIEGYRYTKAQCLEWPKWEAAGVGVWIMFDDTEDQYANLFQPANFRDFWKPRYDKYRDDESSPTIATEEYVIQGEIIEFMEKDGWFCRETHGNSFQRGYPDLFCWHPIHGMRWIDCKNPAHYKYTKAQCQEWPKWAAGGVGVWIMFEATRKQYQTLFAPPNWRDYWKDSYNRYNTPIADIISDIRL